MSDPALLFVASEAIWPPRNGVTVRSFHLARALAAKTRLTLVQFVERDDDAVPPIEGLEDVHCLPLRHVGLEALSRRFELRYSGMALTGVVAGRRFDVGHVDMLGLGHLLPKVDSISRVSVWNLSDCPTHVFRCGWRNAPVTNPLRAVETSRLERRWSRFAEHVDFVTPFEAGWCTHVRPRGSVRVTTNGAPPVQPRTPPARNGPVKFGMMTALAGGHGTSVRRFLKRVWPTVHQRTGAHLLVVGRPDGAVAAVLDAVREAPGVTHMGQVEDLSAFFDDVDATILTLRHAQGLSNKVLESVHGGRPVFGYTAGLQPMRELLGSKAVLTGRDDHALVAQLIQFAETGPVDRRFYEAAAAARRRWPTWENVADRYLGSLS